MAGTKNPIDQGMRWNFSESRTTFVSLDEFLAQQEADGFKFFDGKEPWLKGLNKLSWQTFFRVCTDEMDDFSQRATKLVIEYCLEVLEEVAEKSRAKSRVLALRPLSTPSMRSNTKIWFSSTTGRCAIPWLR